MTWNLRLPAMVLLGVFAMNEAQGDDGALPRGRTAAPGGGKAVTSEPSAATAPAVESTDCMSYMANPEDGETLFSQDGRLVYFLSRQAGESGPEGKTFLYEVDLEKLQSRRLVGLKAGDNPGLIGHGTPLEALTLLDFRKGRPGCGEGFTAGMGIKWIGSQKILKSYPAGNYKLIPSDQGRLLADMDQHSIKLIDLNSFQKRTLASFPDKFLPLFLRSTTMQLIGFRPLSNELMRFEGVDPEPVAVLKLKKGMRLVQDQNQFGIVTSDEGGRVLQVKQIKGWSGDAFRSIDIQLPEGMTAERVGVNVDFGSGICLVQGATPSLRRELRQVLIYKGAKGQTDRILKAPEGQYFSQAVFAPKNLKILVLARSLKDHGIQSLRIGEIGSGVWQELPMATGKPGERMMPAEKNSADKDIERAAKESGARGGKNPSE